MRDELYVTQPSGSKYHISLACNGSMFVISLGLRSA